MSDKIPYTYEEYLELVKQELIKIFGNENEVLHAMEEFSSAIKSRYNRLSYTFSGNVTEEKVKDSILDLVNRIYDFS